jgi:hypothetical protein
MKRGGYILALILLACVAFPVVTAADYTCPINQQIFRISSQTNAHAEQVIGATGYGTQICFDDYFPAFAGTPNRVCDVNNPPILKLSATSNAHAEIPSLTNYNFGVCYGGLACVVQTAACGVGKTEIASLSSNTNAHVGIPGTYTGTGSYRVCCSVGTIPPAAGGANFSSVEWRNGLGVRIGQTVGRSAYVTQTVTMNARTQFPAGTSITFEVWEEDALDDDFIRTITAPVAADGSVQASYTISESDTHIGENEASPLEFYFNMYTTNRALSSETNRSDDLSVILTSPPNNPPVANITAPVHRGIYYRGTTVEFNQTSLDADGDGLTYRWSIAEDNYVNTNPSFVYTFSTAGQKTITLRVTDTRGAIHEMQVGVIIATPTPGVLTFISRPVHQQTIVNSTLWVQFNASDSYVINNVAGPSCPVVSCLAGLCPVHTENVPAGCAQATLPVTNTPQGFQSLYFDWSFNDGDAGAAFDGFGRTTVLKRFGTASSASFDKQANLQVNYSSTQLGIANLLGTTTRVFTLLNDQCIDSGRTFVDFDPITGQELGRYPTMNSIRCAGADGVAGNAGDCCPVGYACSTSPSNPGCRPTSLTMCNQYTNRTICGNDPYRLGNSSQNPGWNIGPACGSYVNGAVVSCACVWNGTSELNGACQFRKSYQSTSNPGGGCTPASCTYGSTSPTQCIDGFATVFVTADYYAGTCADQGITQQECEASEGQQAILCGQPSVALGFFDYKQFIISVIVIAGIYFFMYRRRL